MTGDPANRKVWERHVDDMQSNWRLCGYVNFHLSMKVKFHAQIYFNFFLKLQGFLNFTSQSKRY